MAHTGKLLRMRRFHYANSRCGLIVPIDHGLTLGPVEGLVSVGRIGSWLAHPGVTGIIAHKGLIERLVERDLIGKVGVMLHLNGMSFRAQTPDRKEMLTDIDTALRLGVDGVSVQVNYDGTNDAHNMTLLSSVVDEAHRYGIPVLTMLYDKVPAKDDATRIERLRHLLRISLELGSDALKIESPRSLEEIPVILDGVSEDISIFFAGGALRSDEEVLTMARQAVRHGAAGLCMGRNVFQRESADALLSGLSALMLSREKPDSPTSRVEVRRVA